MATPKGARGSLLGLRRGTTTPTDTSALALRNLEQQERQARALNMAAEAAAQGVKTRKRIISTEAASAALQKLYTNAKDKNSRVHVASVDVLGSIAGFISFEGINWLLRKIEKYSPGFAENTDYWQSLPHLVIGLIIYWVELLTRKPDDRGLRIFPSMPREVAHEWSKVFSLLGASNLWRALAVRKKDAKNAMAQVASLQAEIATLNKRLEELTASKGS